MLTLSEHDAAQAVAWANSLRAAEQISGYGLAPSTLEDAYLGLTSPRPEGTDPSHQEGLRV